MPRNNGVYSLPSPPMPLVPDTLAAAEDLNVVLSDIAAAVTGSMAVDGSTPFTGPVNFNGQNVGGIGALSASTLSASGWITTPNLNVTGGATIAALYGSLNANGANITGVNALTAVGATITNLTVGNNLVVSNALVVSNLAYINALGGALNANGQDITGVGNLYATNLGVYNVTAQGAFINLLGQDLNANGHSITGIGTLSAVRVLIGDDGGGNHALIWRNDGWHMLWSAVDGATRWASPGTELMKLDAGGNLATLGTVNLHVSGAGRAVADPLAALRALDLAGEVDVGAVLALLLGAVQLLARQPA